VCGVPGGSRGRSEKWLTDAGRGGERLDPAWHDEISVGRGIAQLLITGVVIVSVRIAVIRQNVECPKSPVVRGD
jgi:hypothetical protein